MDEGIFSLHAQLEEGHWWFQARAHIIQRLCSCLLGNRRQATILDLGCGTGGILAGLAGEYQCRGLDPSAQAISLARRRYPRVAFQQCHPSRIFDEGVAEADLVLLLDVLEHLPDPAPALARLVSRLRPGSHLLITVPADMRLWSPHDLSYHHYRRYQAEELAALWRNLPVQERLLAYFNSRLYPLVLCLRTISGMLGSALGGRGTDLRPLPQPLNALLQRIMAGESRVLVELLQGRRQRGYRRGVSLAAVLRRC